MVTGEKDFEVRKMGAWIDSRLLDKKGKAKPYDLVKFTYGYGNRRPYFICEFKGVKATNRLNRAFSNGFVLNIEGQYWVILLGKVVEKGNLEGL
jgi:hypothetical protein